MSDLGAGKRPASAARHNAGPQPAGHVALGCGVPRSGLPTRRRGPGARRALSSRTVGAGGPGAPSPAGPAAPARCFCRPWGEGHLLCLRGLLGSPQLLAAHRSPHRADWGAPSLCFAHPGQCRLGPASEHYTAREDEEGRQPCQQCGCTKHLGLRCSRAHCLLPANGSG